MRARPIPVFATLALGPAAAYGATYSTSCICTFCQIWCKTGSGTFNSGTCC